MSSEALQTQILYSLIQTIELIHYSLHLCNFVDLQYLEVNLLNGVNEGSHGIAR